MFGKIMAAALLVLLIGVVGSQLVAFWKKERHLSGEFRILETKFNEAQKNNDDLARELQYLANPLNLEKELRARFNFRKPDETLLIIVPPASSTVSSSSR
jgi:hypothetical protein